MDKVTQVVNQLVARNPQAILLYGSHAWGTPNADSDIDLLLIENTQEPFIDRIRDVNRMLTGKIPVDVMVVNPQEYSTLSNSSSFYKQIASKGKVVYGRI